MQSGSIVGVMQVTTERVKKPQSRVGGMIKPFLFSIWKHVWDESIANVMRESAQNIPGFQTATGYQRESFQRNHGIASPIGEPMIASDHRSHFIAGGVRASGFFRATSRGDNELVTGKNELGRKSTARFRQRIIQHFRAPFFFRRRRAFGREDINYIPFFRRTDDRGHVSLPHIDMKKSRAPEITFVSVTAALLDTVNHLVNDLRQNRELRAIVCQFYAQRRQAAVRGADFIAIFNRTQTIRRGHSFIHRRLVMAEEKGGSQLEPRAFFAFENTIDDVNGVLQMQHQNAFLENEVAHAIGPNRQSIFESELVQKISRAQLELPAGAFFGAERDDIVIRETQEFRNVTPHHHATVRRWQSGDEQTMITAGDCA